MGSGGRPSVPVQPKMPEVEVVKSRHADGFHLIEVNLDANSDGNSVSPWSIVLISAITILAVWILVKVRSCLTHHMKRKAGSYEIGPLRIERPKPANNDTNEVELVEEVIVQPPMPAVHQIQNARSSNKKHRAT